MVASNVLAMVLALLRRVHGRLYKVSIITIRFYQLGGVVFSAILDRFQGFF
jgi:hypothetical protein